MKFAFQKMSELIQKAMAFAIKAHQGQERKYTGEPYWKHLAEVAGIVASCPSVDVEMIAAAWLHDTVEDTGVSLDDIEREFGFGVAVMVSGLTDSEEGANRAERKQKARDRLRDCSGRIQTIKCADLISNTASIVRHDPKFAKVYLDEKRALLDVMTKADPHLHAMASNISK